MIHCADQFEVYDTQTLEDQTSLVTNYGDQRRVTGVRNSLKKDDRQSITFVEDKKVYRLHRDTPDMSVKVDFLVDLAIGEDDWAYEAWVLDGIIAVRVNDDEFRFFMEPLVQSIAVEPLPMAKDLLNSTALADEAASTQSFDYSKLLVYNFAPNNRETEYTLFALRNKEMIKIVYTFDDELIQISESVSITEN